MSKLYHKGRWDVPKTIDQSSLGLEIEEYTTREKFLVECLEGYRLLDRDIAEQQKIIDGTLSRVPLSLSSPPMREDDPAVMATLRTQKQSESFQFIASAVKKHVDASRDRYTDRQRVARRLNYIRSDDADEERALQDAYMILTERETEEFLHLTSTERYAVMREGEIDDAQEMLDMLQRRKGAIEHSLSDMEQFEPGMYEFLWSRYVKGEKYSAWVVKLSGSLDNTRPYRTLRRKALRQFDKWAVGLC